MNHSELWAEIDAQAKTMEGRLRRAQQDPAKQWANAFIKGLGLIPAAIYVLEEKESREKAGLTVLAGYWEDIYREILQKAEKTPRTVTQAA